MGNREDIQRLLNAYLLNRTSREEFDKLLAALSTLDDADFRETVFEALGDDLNLLNSDFVDARVDQLYPSLLAKVRASSNEADRSDDVSKPAIHWVWWRMAASVAAAGILLVLWLGDHFRHNNEPKKEIANVTAGQILAGGNRATLTLADGRKLDLSNSQQGITIGKHIRYLDGTEVLDSTETDKTYPSSHIELLTLATPNGGQYQVTLPDGSRVWLNASSSITYPGAFSGGKREVTLRGEAYFEVTKDAAKPFIVNTETQRVTVLGTSFNINAYTNENHSKTTLLTGSVRVNIKSGDLGVRNEKVLEPGQQSVIGDNGRTVAIFEVDPTTAVAWKNGLFDFHGLNIEEAMKQIERWYDVKVIFKGPKATAYLGGKMSRGVRLSTFLEFLEKDFHIKSEIRPDRTLVLHIPKDTNH